MPDETTTTTDGSEPKIEAPPIDTSAEGVLKRYAETLDTIKQRLGDRGKLEDEVKSISEKLGKLQARERNTMEFAAPAQTRALFREGGIRKVLETPSDDERVRELQRRNDELLVLNAVMDSAWNEERAAYLSRGGYKSLRAWETFNSVRSEFEKAMDTATAGEGSEWVPSLLSSQLQSVIDLELRVASLHRSFPMPAPEYKLPIRTTHATGYKAAEQGNAAALTAITLSKPGTDDITFTAVKVAGRVMWTGEMSEDSVVPMLPFLTQDLGTAVGRAIETGTINGQPGGTIDTGDAPGATDARALWDGYRKYAETNSTVKYDMGSAFTVEGFTELRKKLAKTGVSPANLAWVVSPSVFFQMLNLKDANDNPVVTPAYAYTPAMATALTGEMGALQGIPVIVSEFVREDLNATGIYDGVTETKTIVLCIHKPSWMYGTRRELTVRSSDELYMEYDNLVIVATARMDFNALFPFANQRAVSVGYNITS